MLLHKAFTGAFTTHTSMALLLLLLINSPPGGAGPMGLMIGHFFMDLGHVWYVCMYGLQESATSTTLDTDLWYLLCCACSVCQVIHLGTQLSLHSAILVIISDHQQLRLDS
jgi:hypothetical protein